MRSEWYERWMLHMSYSRSETDVACCNALVETPPGLQLGSSLYFAESAVLLLLFVLSFRFPPPLLSDPSPIAAWTGVAVPVQCVPRAVQVGTGSVPDRCVASAWERSLLLCVNFLLKEYV